MHLFKGSRRLIRLALRRDRIVLPVSIGLVLLLVVGSIPALLSAYPDYAAQLPYITGSAASIVGRVFQGTVDGVNIGSILMAEVYLNAAVIISIISAFVVTRHTRHNEETGAAELLGSTVVGRSAPLSAALMLAVAMNLLIAIVTFVVLSSFSEFDSTGSAFFALSLLLVGIFFAAVAAVTSQLSDYRRGANSMAIGIIGLSFIVRGLGDALGDVSADGFSIIASWISWLSPIGWGYLVIPFNQNNILPLVLLLIGSIALIIFAYFLHRKRDIGSSIFPARPGPARAPSSLLSISGLARRLQRGGLIGWLIGYAVVGTMIAVVANDFRETFADNEAFQSLIASSGAVGSLTDTIIATMYPIVAALLSGYVVSSLIKMSNEESLGRLEYVLATAASKARWLWSHVTFIIFGVIANFFVMGIFGGISYNLVSEVGQTSGFDIFWAAMVNIPAMLVMLSALLAVYAVFGRIMKAIAWFFFAYCALIGNLAGIFEWPQWTTYLSPFAHTPVYPAMNFDWLPIALMSGLSVILLAVATNAFVRRDIALK